MNKFFKENGFLSEEGNKLLQPLQLALTDIMNSSSVSLMTEQELHVLQANLAKLVGDTISNSILNKKEIVNPLLEMSYFEFQVYMTEKYGPHWVLHSLTKEELELSNKFVDAQNSDK